MLIPLALLLTTAAGAQAEPTLDEIIAQCRPAATEPRVTGASACLAREAARSLNRKLPVQASATVSLRSVAADGDTISIGVLVTDSVAQSRSMVTIWEEHACSDEWTARLTRLGVRVRYSFRHVSGASLPGFTISLCPASGATP